MNEKCPAMLIHEDGSESPCIYSARHVEMDNLRFAHMDKHVHKAAVLDGQPAIVGEPAVQIARSMGHDMEWDPPAALTRARRWTCTRRECGEAVIDYDGNISGDAATRSCTAWDGNEGEHSE